MKAITTTYNGKAYVAYSDRNGITIAQEIGDAANDDKLHRRAAVALIRKMGWGPVSIVSGSVGDCVRVHVMVRTAGQGIRAALASLTNEAIYPVEGL